MFVRDDIVEDGNQPGVFVAPDDAGNGAEAGCHEGQPELGDHQVGFLAFDFVSDLEPVERVVGVHFADDFESFRSRFGAVLGFPWEQEIRILVGEGVDFHFVPLVLEFVGNPLIEGGESPAIGVCCSENDDFHRVIV